MLLRTIKKSVKSVTGYNLRRIMLELGMTNIDQLNNVGMDNIDGFTSEELEEIVSQLCVS